MRVAVIGAGIVGVTTAQALADDGHEVTIFERESSVATEASFANAGVLAPGYVTPWAAPGMVRKVLSQCFDRDAAMRLVGLPRPATLRWLARWWRACGRRTYTANRAAMLALARDSLERTRAIAQAREIEFEQGRGLLVLLRDGRDVALARPGLKLLSETGVAFHLVDGAACRRIEPALDESTALKAGIHLPDAGLGNCRQFAHAVKAQLQARGVPFRFHHAVDALAPGERGVALTLTERPADAASTFGAGGDSLATTRDELFNAVVVCAGVGAPALLRSLHIRLPVLPVYGYSVTLPVRHFEAHPDVGPRAALIDERYKVAITRLGARVRVAGSAELGGRPDAIDGKAIATLYRVLQDWFPSAPNHAQVQTWKGARPMLPDGPPAIGATRIPGVWLNTGHGSSGWALACGSARLVADLIAGRAPAVDATRFSPLRWS